MAHILTITVQLQESLDMNDSEYLTGLSVLFVGYVLMQVPSNMFLNWCGRPSWYLGKCFLSEGDTSNLTYVLGFWTIAWGLVSAVTSQVDTFGQIVACRFILGFVEAPFFPGVLLWVTRTFSSQTLSWVLTLSS
jgi:MFS family permease